MANAVDRHDSLRFELDLHCRSTIGWVGFGGSGAAMLIQLLVNRFRDK